MTTMSKRNNKFLSLLIFAVVAFPTANALSPQEIDTICKESQEIQVCEEFIKKDPIVVAATSLDQVLLLVCSLTKITVDQATTHLNDVRQKFSGPLGKKRIGVCENDYNTAANKFHFAWLRARFMNLTLVNKMVREGLAAVISCENNFKMNGPLQNSPFTVYNQRILKLSKIIFYLIRKLRTKPK